MDNPTTPKAEHPLMPWARWLALIIIGIVTAWLTTGKVPAPPVVSPLSNQTPPPFVVLVTTGTNGSAGCQCLTAEKK